MTLGYTQYIDPEHSGLPTFYAKVRWYSELLGENAHIHMILSFSYQRLLRPKTAA